MNIDYIRWFGTANDEYMVAGLTGYGLATFIGGFKNCKSFLYFLDRHLNPCPITFIVSKQVEPGESVTTAFLAPPTQNWKDMSVIHPIGERYWEDVN
jgi:hypothetical protein